MNTARFSLVGGVVALALALPALPAMAADASTGQDVYARLQNGALTCEKLTDDDFDGLGDFLTVRMMGSSADGMNQAMAQRLGSDGERQAHIAMGKRFSGCDTNANYPNNNYAPAAWMMGGSMMGYVSSMMGGYGTAGWLGEALFWLVLIGLIVGLATLFVRGSGFQKGGNAIDILKERYAKGEIDKDEFERKRKDLEG